MTATTLTRELYEGLQRAEFDRWDAVVADDVLINSPAPPCSGSAVYRASKVPPQRRMSLLLCG